MRSIHGGFGHASFFIDDGAEGNVVTFEFTGIPRGAAIELSVTGESEKYLFNPAASFLSSTPGIQWTGESNILFVNCYLPGASAPRPSRSKPRRACRSSGTRCCRKRGR